MINLDALQRDRDAKASAASSLLERTMQTAEAEKREITDDETAAIKSAAAEVRALDARIAANKSQDALIDEIRGMGTPRPAATAPALVRGYQSLGDQFVNHPSYDFFRKGQHRSSSVWRSPAVELDPAIAGGWFGDKFRAATLTSDPASGGALIAPQYLPGVQEVPTRRLVIADLFAPGTTESNVISYMQESTFTNAAAPVLEGGIKPESTLAFAAMSDPVRKIAHWLPVTEEMLEDVPQLRSYIDARLRLGVLIAEEDQLINGSGVAPQLLGLKNRVGLAPDVVRADPMTNADAYLQQTMAIFASSMFMPDGYVMHPSNWASTVMSKTSTGEYYTGGPFSPIQSPTLWGLPVAVTPAIPAGTGWVGAFKMGGQVFRKGGIRVEASNSHADFFIKNLVAIRAEERIALAIYRPGAFGEVTGLTPVVVGTREGREGNGNDNTRKGAR